MNRNGTTAVVRQKEHAARRGPLDADEGALLDAIGLGARDASWEDRRAAHEHEHQGDEQRKAPHDGRRT